VLTADTERPVLGARLAGLDDLDVIGAEDVPDLRRSSHSADTGLVGCPEQQFAMLAVRLEMTARIPATG
jgi:hypothetical protein